MKSRHSAAFVEAKAERDARRYCHKHGHQWARHPRTLGGIMYIKPCRRCPAGLYAGSKA